MFGYGVNFAFSHLTWATSLMFLFSGRGYWQELIESVVWSHTKLNIVPNVQPKALSIIQGRFIGIYHYVFGNFTSTFSFILSRVFNF